MLASVPSTLGVGGGVLLALVSCSPPSCLLLCNFEPGSCPGEGGDVATLSQEGQDMNSSHVPTCLFIPRKESPGDL